MNYESTTFLFRNGTDDYTLWVVDLSKTELSRISRNNLTILGNLDDLMEQIRQRIEAGERTQEISIFLMYDPCPGSFAKETLSAGVFFSRR